MKKLLNNKYTIPILFLLLITYIFLPGSNKFIVCQTTLDHEEILKNKKTINFIPKEFVLVLSPKQEGFYVGAFVYPRSILPRSKNGHVLSLTEEKLRSIKYSAYSDFDEMDIFTFKDTDGNETSMWHLNRSSLVFKTIDKEKTTGVIFPTVATCNTLSEINGTPASFSWLTDKI